MKINDRNYLDLFKIRGLKEKNVKKTANNKNNVYLQPLRL